MGRYIVLDNKKSLLLHSWLGYVLFVSSVAGYVGYDTVSIWLWILVALAGVFFLGYKNMKLKSNKQRAILLDGLYVIVLPFIAAIPSPGGLSILLMTLIGGFIAPLFMHLAFRPWSKKT